jgi:predicted RNase H-like nuclease (RuvC/YqgF family)
MFYLSIPLSVLEVVILCVVAIITIAAIRFFVITQRNLRQTMERASKAYGYRSIPAENAATENSITQFFQQFKARIRPGKSVGEPAAPMVKPTSLPKEETAEHLKATIQQQQRLLSGFLKQVEELEGESKGEMQLQNKALQKEIKMLELQLEEKDAELAELHQQNALSDRMTSRIEEVYQELEELQAKMMLLEKQANRANNLALELEDTRELYEQIHKELQRKNEKLSEVFAENEDLKANIRELEDKLAEANLQRQQLQRKTQFLQDLNTDLQSISDTNKKLSSELRRIGELESMLNMIAEERDFLLKKQSGK